MIKQEFLVATNLAWEPTNQLINCLVTWEVFGGGLMGNLLTDSSNIELSLWPETKYIVQVTCKNKVSIYFIVLVSAFSSSFLWNNEPCAEFHGSFLPRHLIYWRWILHNCMCMHVVIIETVQVYNSLCSQSRFEHFNWSRTFDFVIDIHYFIPSMLKFSEIFVMLIFVFVLCFCYLLRILE